MFKSFVYAVPIAISMYFLSVYCNDHNITGQYSFLLGYAFCALMDVGYDIIKS